MKKALGVFMTGLLAMVFAFGDVPLYACAKQNSLHILKSCCAKKLEVKVKKSCCGSEETTENQPGEILSEICCNSIDHQLTMPFVAAGDVEINLAQGDNLELYVAFYEPVLPTNLLNKLGNNKSPPRDTFIALSSNKALFILHNAYLC
ncbi:hypothetical protein LNTAR_00320 [Lentisphaera araneosa HTCC2155]|jgi:hypothetical protein|uniref:Uncharacterized protein n=1 Tax=Lentisphaera araneosa HTCC2155 TaxID=313628 RepID=A6DKA1_9BACT|nr:hypothetical protein [Lentisphaera araneosa]EDM27799.1 hypothetical protein LNTAR_00320 [Lentisphaera araneosa HTCC2155]